MSLYKSLNLKVLNAVSLTSPLDPKWRLVNARLQESIPTFDSEASALAYALSQPEGLAFFFGEMFYVDSSDEYKVKRIPPTLGPWP